MNSIMISLLQLQTNKLAILQSTGSLLRRTVKARDWSNGTGTSTLENAFLYGFAEYGMIQCVHEATHTKN